MSNPLEYFVIFFMPLPSGTKNLISFILFGLPCSFLMEKLSLYFNQLTV